MSPRARDGSIEGGAFLLAGFADEAADSALGQARVTTSLGWKWLEARNVEGLNAHDLGEREFEAFRAALENAGIGVCCLGSSIANWGKSVDEDFAASLATANRAAARMKALGTKLVRIMSYAILLDAAGDPLPDQKKRQRFERLRELCGVFAAEGMTPVHENCFNYGGMGVERSLELLSEVPGLKLVFDTGNPALTPDFSWPGPRPRPSQDPWKSWLALRDHVAHIHIKDGWRDPLTGAETYVYPGEGPSRVRDILEDCLARGYSGWLSIEPHMAVVYHDSSVSSPAAAREAVYLEYGKRLEAMLRSLGCEIRDGIALRDSPAGKPAARESAAVDNVASHEGLIARHQAPAAFENAATRRSFTVDRLRVRVYADRATLGVAAAADCAAAIRKVLAQKERCRMVFAAAPSQNEFLAGLAKARGIDWSRVEAFHMDEYAGLASGDSRRFGEFLRKALFSKLAFGRVEYLWPATAAGDQAGERGSGAEEEAKRYAALLAGGPIDIVCMGVGENGHIAFNDPRNADFADPLAVKEVALDPECRLQQVHDGCFPSLEEVPETALTLTVPTLMSGRELFCVVPGPTKAAAMRRMLKGEVSPECPATALRGHPACTLYLDENSAKGIP